MKHNIHTATTSTEISNINARVNNNIIILKYSNNIQNFKSNFSISLTICLVKKFILLATFPYVFFRNDGKRVDCVTLAGLPWARSRWLLWDFACPDTLAPSHIHIFSIVAGSAAL